MRPDAIRGGHMVDAAREAIGYAAGSNHLPSLLTALDRWRASSPDANVGTH